MFNILLLSTAWGTKFGGINAFNFDFARALAKRVSPSGHVYCAVFASSLAEIQEAAQHNITLIDINRPINSDAYDKSWALDVWQKLREVNSGVKIDYWVGHDVTTGWAALEGPVVAEHGRAALIMHMKYSDYQTFKSGIGARAAAKIRDQRALFSKADLCFGVGPLLRDALSDIISAPAQMLIPGFADVAARPPLSRIQAITFGRMDRENDRIKQGSLAVAGFASAIRHAHETAGSPRKLKENPQIRIIGIKEPDNDEERELKRIAATFSERQINLIATPYDEDRGAVWDELGRASIALMLSWHEGFGLTGWEAIAAGVPLILGTQTGLWQLLKDTLGDKLAAAYVKTIDVRGQDGLLMSSFRPEDVDQVRDAILDVVANLAEARVTAANLRRELASRLGCTWDHTADDFLTALGAAARPTLRAPVPTTIDRRVRTAALHTFLQTDFNVKFTESRQRLLTNLTASLDPQTEPRRQLVILRGGFGVGKSTVAAHWWAMSGMARYHVSAIRIACGDKALDQITRDLTKYYIDEERERIDADVREELRVRMHNLIVFDQLFAVSHPRPEAPQTGLSFREALRLVSQLFALGQDLKVLMCVQGEEREVLGSLEPSFFVDVEVSVARLQPLTPEEGAQLFRLEGCDELSDKQLRDLSARLVGLPISIAAAASQLKMMDPIEQETYVLQYFSPGASPNVFNNVFRQYLNQLTGDKVQSTPHPHALLRLLALMPGVVSKGFLQDLISRSSISRLGTLDVNRIVAGRFAFIAVAGTKVDLHPMARAELRRELSEIVAGKPDPYTNIDELKRIHLEAAKLHRSTFRAFSSISRLEVEAIEYCIYHLLQVRDLVSSEVRRWRALPVVTRTMEERTLSGDASRLEITAYCYKVIAEKFLLESRKSVTRLLGLYETKARILMLFLDDRSINGEVRYLGPLDCFRLFMEIAVCFQHAGRLRLAGRAVERASKVVQGAKTARNTNRTGRDLIITRSSSRRAREQWAREVEIMYIGSLIDIRKGRQIHRIFEDIQAHVPTANHVAQLAETGFVQPNEGILEYDQKTMKGANVLKAAVRVFSRLGHVNLLRGDVEQSLFLFERARAIEQYRRQIEYKALSIADALQAEPHGSYLTGEAARRQSAALLRGLRHSATRLETADKIVEYNIMRHERIRAQTSQIQNDVIPFYIMRATIQRMRGDLSRARDTIGEVESHEYVRSGECAFIALVDLEIERTKIAILSENDEVALAARMEALIARLDAEHHSLQAAECGLLLAEVSQGDARESAIGKADSKLADQGVHLWDNDLKILRRGRSALRSGIV